MDRCEGGFPTTNNERRTTNIKVMSQKSRAEIRQGVHSRIRKKVSGTAERPRLAVFRSVSHIYAQIIDDIQGLTLAAASSLDADLKDKKLKNGAGTDAATEVGKLVAARAKKAGVSKVVFDRGRYLYHGRVKAVAEGARTGGLEF